MRVHLFGDPMIDYYCYVDNEKFLHTQEKINKYTVDKIDIEYGGALNVFNSILHLNIPILFYSLCTDNDKSILNNIGSEDIVNSHMNLVTNNTINDIPKKIRIIKNNKLKCRYDIEKIIEIINVSIQNSFRNLTYKFINNISDMNNDIICLSNYGKGYIHNYLIVKLFNIIKYKDIPVLVDPKFEDWTIYFKTNNIVIIKCNEHELNKQIEQFNFNRSNLPDNKFILCTRGEKGYLWMTNKKERFIELPNVIKDESNIIGAGDLFLSYFIYYIKEYEIFPNRLETLYTDSLIKLLIKDCSKQVYNIMMNKDIGNTLSVS